MIFIIAKSADPWKLQVRYGVSRPRLPRRPAGEQAEVGRAPEEGVAQVEEAGEAEEACGGPLRCMLGLVMLGWGREFGVRDCGGGRDRGRGGRGRAKGRAAGLSVRYVLLRLLPYCYSP